MAVSRFKRIILGFGLTGTDNGDDTITFTAGGRWEIVMEDGVTAPPVPLTNEAEDDWLYAYTED